MGDYASGRTLRGTNVRGSLYKDGAVQDVIVAEEIDLAFETDDLATDPLVAAFTQHEQFPNSVMITVKGVRKGNRFLKLYGQEFLAASKAGRPMAKFSFVANFIDVNTNTALKVELVDGALKADPFNSGPRTGKQSEGFTLQGNLKSIG